MPNAISGYSLLVKPVSSSCNLRCGYCFYEGLSSKASRVCMSDQVLETMIKDVMTHRWQNNAFAWQGGEPTLAGVDFFRKVVELQKKHGASGQSVSNAFQTNGILINREWIDLFSRYKFLVGLSLDGPEHIHNHYRKFGPGKGSHEKVMKTAEMLGKSSVEFNTLVVVSDYSAAYPEEILDFMMENNLKHPQFIPAIDPAPDTGAPLPYCPSPEQYGEFLCRLFDHWYEQYRHECCIRDFDSFIMSYSGLEPEMCIYRKECGTYILVEHNGDIYPCDFFVYPEWKIGSLSDMTLDEAYDSDAFNRFRKLKKALAKTCRSCPWFTFCRGGCPRAAQPVIRHSGNGSYFCRSYSMFLEHADSRLKEISRQVREQHKNSPRAQEILKNTRRNDPCPCGSGIKFKNCCMHLYQ